ncbi:MAG: hypothetical protein ACTSU5_00840 [Promethearchaeota archaeon]
MAIDTTAAPKNCGNCGNCEDCANLVWLEDGYPRCSITGEVFEDLRVFDTSPPRSFNTEKFLSRAQNEKVTRPAEYRTQIWDSDLKNCPDSSAFNSREDWKRRFGLQAKNDSSRQSNFRRANRYFERLKRHFALSDRVFSHAQRVYAKVQKMCKMSGRSIEEYVLGSVMVACKIDGSPLSIKKVKEVVEGLRTDPRRGLQSVLRLLDKGTRSRYFRPVPMSVMFSKVKGLFNFSPQFEATLERALEFLGKVKKFLPNLKTINKVAGVISFYCGQAQELGDGMNFRTQRKIAEVTSASVSGLQAVKKELTRRSEELTKRGLPSWVDHRMGEAVGG